MNIKPHHQPANRQTLRIIAGQWRGRKLSFAATPGLRPTPDRVRETLFNWLQGSLLDASCLDLFAGSGALGFEALSRGAKQVTFIENNNVASRTIKKNIRLLKTEQAVIIPTDAFSFLDSLQTPADIIFLDPPFRKNYIPQLLSIIYQKELLKDNGFIYLEHEIETNGNKEKAPGIAALDHFNIIKEKKAGQVISKLLTLAT